MKYDNIKKCKVSHEKLAKMFRYKNVSSFRCSKSHRVMMEAIDELLGIGIEVGKEEKGE
jgi:hypothetical protein